MTQMSHPEVAAAFDLLADAMEASICALNQEGATLLREGRYAEAKKHLALAEGLSKLAAEPRTLRQKWETTLAPVPPPAPPRPNAPRPSRDGLAIEMRYNDAHATATYNRGRVILEAGTTVRKPIYPSLSERLLEIRRRSLSDGTLTPTGRDDLLLLTRDIEFGSPSAAAQFVAGCSVSGNRDWHVTATGMPLGEYLRHGASQGPCPRTPSRAAHRDDFVQSPH